MANLTPKKPSIQVEQAKKFLIAFYRKPLTQVSTELFFTLAATIFFALFAIRPTILTMTDLVKEIEDKQEALDSLNKKVTALSTVQNEYFTLQSQFYLLDETVPTEVDFERILKSIEKSASDLQLSIATLQVRELPLPEDKPLAFNLKTPQIVNITVNVSGSYDKIKTYIDSITKLRPLLTIESLSFTNSGLENATYLTATVRLEAHYFGKPIPKEGEGGAAAPDQTGVEEAEE